MDELSEQERAVELLQQLGLKEYEARCFAALARVPRATAKRISEISEVPRTRVYDAIRVLETKGLVETQHSNPQQFRAVSVKEAASTLREEYEERTHMLRDALVDLNPVPPEDDEEVTHEVWALSGEASIANRTVRLIDEAEEEIVVVIGDDEVFTNDMAAALRHAKERRVEVLVGTIAEELRARIQDAVHGAEVFVSGLEWLTRAEEVEEGTEITRLLMVDRATILVSVASARSSEQAVFGRGFENGLVVVVRRLMSTGMPPRQASDSEA